MTGFDLFRRVCSLLGCQEFAENGENEKTTAFCGMINQIAQDLGLEEIKSLTDEIPLKDKQREALVYGCAMLFSVSLGDNACARMYSQLYNSKRSKALSTTDKRYDVLPSTLKGGH